ncbi:hypothetical protein key_147 [Erwinia phage KEY]|uniref:Uncharacterized protein n=1 Tax=Erwinia phage KEY TaxID=2821255 RepID=A0AAE7WE20_9CAUD|nr:hypothetical protein key_147 [Erwinia phage KEY]
MLIRWLKVSRVELLHAEIGKLEQEVLELMREKVKLLKEYQQTAAELVETKAILIATLEEMLDDKQELKLLRNATGNVKISPTNAVPDVRVNSIQYSSEHLDTWVYRVESATRLKPGDRLFSRSALLLNVGDTDE